MDDGAIVRRVKQSGRRASAGMHAAGIPVAGNYDGGMLNRRVADVADPPVRRGIVAAAVAMVVSLLLLSGCGGNDNRSIEEICRGGGCVCNSNFPESHPSKWWPVSFRRDGTPFCQQGYWLEVDHLVRDCRIRACYCMRPGVYRGAPTIAPVSFDGLNRAICPPRMVLRPARDRPDP